MRSFQLLSIVTFLLFYALVSFGAVKTVLRIVSPANKKKVLWLMLLFSVIVVAGFVMLYIWPLTTRNTKEYTLHIQYLEIMIMEITPIGIVKQTKLKISIKLFLPSNYLDLNC
jgi:hypothetical protein